ncbi:MAG TPA: hypothetical protein VH113_01290 [Gemmatimonadales bacterium]|jgi:hypothetical protein|nr:hypothetical protein [Gemmatimonadales bacterium]
MLNTVTQGSPLTAGPTRRPPRSQKQEYQEFLLQRIEEYKNTVPREELLRIGDEAVRELESGQGQYLLTEVLLLEHVDRIISRRLKLPSFRRWSQNHRALRQAQREPTHWGLEASDPVAQGVKRLEAGDVVLVVGVAALPHALFVAAHDAEVFLLDQELGAVESAEGRAVAEQLAGRFQALVVNFGGWLPDLRPALTVVEPNALAAADAGDREALVRGLQSCTRPGGLHVILSVDPDGPGVLPLAPDALQTLYGEWQVERRKRRGRGEGFVATKPARQNDA